MIHANLARRFIRAATRFERLAPWRDLRSDQPVAFVLPDEPHRIYVAVLGDGTTMQGLAMH